MCDTSFNLSRFLFIKSRRSSKLWCSRFSSVLEIFRVTKRLASSSVRTVMGMRIIASRFSTTLNLTCKGLSSGIQKIVVIKCSPCRENSVHFQRMLALECALLSPGRCRVISIGFIREMAIVQIVWYMLTIFVGGGFLKILSLNVKFVDSGGQEKVALSQVSRFSVSIL